MGEVVPPPNDENGGLAPMKPAHFIGIMPNKPHQAPRGIFNMGRYELSIVEFDDQGRCHDRRQMDAIAAWLDASSERDAIIVTFVHGWKHDARSNDDNLANFKRILEQTVGQEAEAHVSDGGRPRPVLGVFVGWRGMSLYDRFGISDNLTFWDRQDAGRRVAVGSVRELFGRFRHYRNRRKDAGGSPLLVISGHSFGGMIVFSALAQALIEAASTPISEVFPRFADLVLLVNPAIEAARYLPIYDLVQLRMKEGRGTDQPPIFVCATAKNDWATGLAFPIGNALSLLTESYRDSQERQAMVNSIGHLPWMKTHDLASNSSGGDYDLKGQTGAEWNPYWVVQATPAVINGHNGIFQPLFLKFIAKLVFAHVEYSRSKRTPRTMS